MSKKHYKLVAKELGVAQFCMGNTQGLANTAQEGFQLAVEAVCLAFERDNPKFNSYLFVREIYEARSSRK